MANDGPTFGDLAMRMSAVAFFGGVVHLFRDPGYAAWRHAFVAAFVAVVACVMVLVFAMFFSAKSKL